MAYRRIFLQAATAAESYICPIYASRPVKHKKIKLQPLSKSTRRRFLPVFTWALQSLRLRLQWLSRPARKTMVLCSWASGLRRSFCSGSTTSLSSSMVPMLPARKLRAPSGLMLPFRQTRECVAGCCVQRFTVSRILLASPVSSRCIAWSNCASGKRWVITGERSMPLSRNKASIWNHVSYILRPFMP
jgi:hypothetical protein